ncbi:MAG: hypothetical protein ACLFR1_04150 [Spirochaetia bacterium]
MIIVEYIDSFHREKVIHLWTDVFGYAEGRNNPELVIDRKLTANDGLFLLQPMMNRSSAQ